MRTAKETTIKVLEHLISQGRCATGPDGKCRYRQNLDGVILKCAAGCLIPDDFYNETMEDKGSYILICQDLYDFPDDNHDLIRELQLFHDTLSIRPIEEQLVAFQMVMDEVQKITSEENIREIIFILSETIAPEFD